MRYPLGEVIHERVPSQFLKFEELIHWMQENQFNGILVGESPVQRTEILITGGKLRHAVNASKGAILFNEEALEVLFADAEEGNLLLSLFKLAPEVCKPLLLPLVVEPRIDKVETKLVVLSYLLDSCKRTDLMSHVVFETNGSEGHMLFLDGKLIGAYTDHQNLIDPESRDFYALYNTRSGKLSLYQATNDEFYALNLPSLDFAPRNAEFNRLSRLLISFLDFTRTAYGNNGLPPEQTMGLFKRIADSMPSSPIVVVDSEFRVIPDLRYTNKLIQGLAELLKKVTSELKEMWGPRVASSRYRRIYDSFLKEIKSDASSVEIIESLSPERIGL